MTPLGLRAGHVVVSACFGVCLFACLGACFVLSFMAENHSHVAQADLCILCTWRLPREIIFVAWHKAFMGCAMLKEIAVPPTLPYIASFLDCTWLTGLNLMPGERTTWRGPLC